ncbi:class I SAM-dependent methyltransferase [Streptomyces sp. NBC_00576]|uniref:class I SAM-dependent methyltransferase n=1 Tax=Streptomyces sp. NBC_00576 TaxID=2903665 RepID=UPI002E820B59|nr:class I SAM-dependent methyltransferase [Streptomyces sp. NBC_00576]WUB71660.1 class I SAM-dependent methyltransferase [Streptomyces sp. NBC_00576]
MPPYQPKPEHPQLTATARSFGAEATRYDRARPRYPEALVHRIVATAPGPDILDVGVGTGIVARQFQAAGCRVLGVEVDDRMAELARRSGVEAEVAAFEEWDPAGRAFDAVVSAQAWHWVDAVAGAAKAARSLRPGGQLALFWNVFQPSPDVTGAFAEVHDRVLPDIPNLWTRPALDSYAPLFAKAADGIRQAGGAFGEPEEWRYEWEHPYTRDEWLDLLPTHGRTNGLPPAQLTELLSATGAALDTLGGDFTVRYTTVAITASRTVDATSG